MMLWRSYIGLSENEKRAPDGSNEFFWQNWGEPCSISGISIEKLENQLIQLKATFSEKEKMLENLKTR